MANRGANTMEMMRQFNWRNESTAIRYTDATKERGRKIAGYFNQVTPTKKKSRQEEPVPGPSGVAGHSQAAVAEEDFVGSSEVAPISPEKEKTQEKEKSPKKEKTPMEGGGDMNEDDEDAFLYATASAVEEQAVAAPPLHWQ